MENSTKRKSWWIYVLIIIGVIAIFRMCGEDDENPDSKTYTETAKLTLPEYTIIDTDCRSEPCNITIRLTEIIDSTKVAAIGKKIRKERSDFKRVYVFFLQPGLIPGSGAWAAVRYNPEPEIEIMGFTQESYQKAKEKMDKWRPEKVWAWHNGLASSLIGIKGKKIYHVYKDLSATEEPISINDTRSVFIERSNNEVINYTVAENGWLVLSGENYKVFANAINVLD